MELLSLVDIYLQLHAKAPTLDQPDLRIEFMVQGKRSSLTIETRNKSLFIFLFYDLTSKT